MFRQGRARSSMVKNKILNPTAVQSGDRRFGGIPPDSQLLFVLPPLRGVLRSFCTGAIDINHKTWHLFFYRRTVKQAGECLT